jgi:hypothetical protein
METLLYYGIIVPREEGGLFVLFCMYCSALYPAQSRPIQSAVRVEADHPPQPTNTTKTTKIHIDRGCVAVAEAGTV